MPLIERGITPNKRDAQQRFYRLAAFLRGILRLAACLQRPTALPPQSLPPGRRLESLDPALVPARPSLVLPRAAGPGARVHNNLRLSDSDEELLKL